MVPRMAPIANLAGMEDIVSAVVSFWAQANLECTCLW